MTLEEAKAIRACNGRGYSTIEFIKALQLTEPNPPKNCSREGKEMITEDYVSFETAKLLSEKGFDYYPDGSYWLIDANNVMYWVSEIGAYDYVDVPTESFQRPKNGYRLVTQAMAMKWLREKYGLFINLYPEFGDVEIAWNPGNFEEDMIGYKITIIDLNYGVLKYKTLIKHNYEQACEAAIKYCLENLI